MTGLRTPPPPAGEGRLEPAVRVLIAAEPCQHESMNCPIDGATLMMSERKGVEIDFCPQCRGIWLDRGELDKLLAAADRYDDDDDDDRREREYRPAYEERRDYDDRPFGGGGYDPRRRKRKKGFLSEMFEFGD